MGKTFFYIVLGIAAILAIVFAWIYLRKPDEIKKDESLGATDSGSPSSAGTGINPSIDPSIGKTAYAGPGGAKVYNKDWTLYKNAAAGEWIGKVYGVSGTYYITSGDRRVNKLLVTLKD